MAEATADAAGQAVSLVAEAAYPRAGRYIARIKVQQQQRHQQACKLVPLWSTIGCVLPHTCVHVPLPLPSAPHRSPASRAPCAPPTTPCSCASEGTQGAPSVRPAAATPPAWWRSRSGARSATRSSGAPRQLGRLSRRWAGRLTILPTRTSKRSACLTMACWRRLCRRAVPRRCASPPVKTRALRGRVRSHGVAPIALPAQCSVGFSFLCLDAL